MRPQKMNSKLSLLFDTLTKQITREQNYLHVKTSNQWPKGTGKERLDVIIQISES